MKKYLASIELENQLEKVNFETEGSPVEYLWGRYGMDSYIEWIQDVTTAVVVPEEEPTASMSKKKLKG